jgi:ABC-type sulfate transport system permease component
MLLVLLALFIRLVVNSHVADFAVVHRFLFNRSILEGLRNTMIISVLAQALVLLAPREVHGQIKFFRPRGE